MNRFHSHTFLLVLLVIIGFSIISPVQAHPPANITLAYSMDTKILSVSISHSVSDTSTHYINKIEVKRGSEILVSQSYTSQPSKSSFTYEYSVDVAEGEVLTVIAYCSVSGSDSNTLTITGDSGSSRTENISALWTFPHFVLILIGLLSMSFGVAFIFLHKPKSWFLLHKGLSSLGVFFTILGILLLPALNLGLLHSVLGLIGAIGMATCIGLGVYFGISKKKPYRSVHIWGGRLAFGLMCIAALIGLILFGVI
jgi:desulfoferrodoxin (superoxide reductase-like protein)